ncbi:histidine kinase [Amycolatopsis suaedae]|uniref:Histidine kinase n=2 Tax=Amycolatopsis suaedae TaxID=2510978 RepID=A0A4Q7J3R9_9PSEU|nr:histidine kinase [Amycolatopsis suaedae]
MAAGLTPARLVLAVASLGALLAIQLLYFSRPSVDMQALRSRNGYLMLGAQAALGYLPLLEFGQAWINMPSFLAGSVLLVLPRPAAWVLFGTIVAGMGAIQAALGGEVLDICYTTVGAALGGLSVFLLTSLARLVNELHLARRELADRAVADERLRFAKDLHDLLGLNLSSIAFKGEVAHRLVHRDPDLAKTALADITAVARRALSDVRSVASEYRERSLEQESRVAQSVLSASDVDVRLDLDRPDLPAEPLGVLATALHEAVANMLRHSRVRRCDITLRASPDVVSLEVVNDGAGDGDDPAAAGWGNGIRRLAARAQNLGGTVTAGPEAPGRFRLRVELPLPAPGGDAPVAEAAPSPQLSGRLAHGLLTTVFAGFGVAAVIHLFYLTESAGHLALTVGALAGILALQLGYFSRPTTVLRSRRSQALLVAQAALVYLPLIELGPNWVSLPGLLAGSALLVLRPAFGLPAFAAVVASIAAVRGGFTTDPGDLPFNVLATINTGTLVFGLTWLTRLTGELESTRHRLAEVAVTEERLRFARDLHDLLGLSLSAIALKTELTDRLLVVDPGRAADELAEILVLCRHALADVRSVASGHQQLSLDEESRAAHAALTAADVEVDMRMHHDNLPVQVRTVLAVVLREGVTNVLRHSKVEHCEITLRQQDRSVVLEIVNDGVRAPGERSRPARREPGGNGIRNLSERVSALGGELTAESRPGGRFRLRAVVPS